MTNNHDAVRFDAFLFLFSHRFASCASTMYNCPDDAWICIHDHVPWEDAWRLVATCRRLRALLQYRRVLLHQHRKPHLPVDARARVRALDIHVRRWFAAVAEVQWSVVEQENMMLDNCHRTDWWQQVGPTFESCIHLTDLRLTLGRDTVAVAAGRIVATAPQLRRLWVHINMSVWSGLAAANPWDRRFAAWWGALAGQLPATLEHLSLRITGSMEDLFHPPGGEDVWTLPTNIRTLTLRFDRCCVDPPQPEDYLPFMLQWLKQSAARLDELVVEMHYEQPMASASNYSNTCMMLSSFPLRFLAAEHAPACCRGLRSLRLLLRPRPWKDPCRCEIMRGISADDSPWRDLADLRHLEVELPWTIAWSELVRLFRPTSSEGGGLRSFRAVLESSSGYSFLRDDNTPVAAWPAPPSSTIESWSLTASWCISAEMQE